MTTTSPLQRDEIFALAALLRRKRAGDTLTYGELREQLPRYQDAPKRALRGVVDYLGAHGVVHHNGSGIQLTGGGSLDGVEFAYAPQKVAAPYEAPARAAAARARPPVDIYPQEAFAYFDPHDRFFRGIVVGEDQTAEGGRRAAVHVLAEGNRHQYGFVSPTDRHRRHGDGVDFDYYVHLGTHQPTKWRQRLEGAARSWRPNQFALLEKIDAFTGRNRRPVYVFEPLVAISEQDGLTHAGRRLATRVEKAGEDQIVYDLPILGMADDGGVGFYDDSPIIVRGAPSGIIVPEARVLGAQMAKQPFLPDYLPNCQVYVAERNG